MNLLPLPTLSIIYSLLDDIDKVALYYSCRDMYQRKKLMTMESVNFEEGLCIRSLAACSEEIFVTASQYNGFIRYLEKQEDADLIKTFKLSIRQFNGFKSLLPLPLFIKHLSLMGTFDDKDENGLISLGIPDHVTHLCIRHRSIGTTFPLLQIPSSSLVSLIINVAFERNIVVGDFDRFKSLEVLHLGRGFNQTLEKGMLPSTLLDLKFGSLFNSNIYRGDLPDSITSLCFGTDFNQSINQSNLPKSLVQLTLGEKFNQPIQSLPSNLFNLKFSPVSYFNQPLSHLTSLRRIKLSSHNKFVNTLPTGTLNELRFGKVLMTPRIFKLISPNSEKIKVMYNPTKGIPQSIEELHLESVDIKAIIPLLPINLKELHLDSVDFGTLFEMLTPGVLPNTIESIWLQGHDEGRANPRSGCFPDSVKKLVWKVTAATQFEDIVVGVFPSRLESLDVYNQVLSRGCIPKTVKILTIELAQPFDDIEVDPTSLQELSIYHSYSYKATNLPNLKEFINVETLSIHLVNEEIELINGTLPPNLKTFSFVHHSPSSYHFTPGLFPDTLLHLNLGAQLIHDFVPYALPNSLLTLKFTYNTHFNSKFIPGSLPPNLYHLCLLKAHSYNQKFEPGSLPPSLRYFSLVDTYPHKLTPDVIPPNILCLRNRCLQN